MLQLPAYWAIRSALALPMIAGPRPSLEAARGMGRAFARMPFNRKRLVRAAEHIRFACPEFDEAERLEHAVRSYEHLFMLGVEVAFTPRLMSDDGWIRHVEFDHIAGGLKEMFAGRPLILITGHCGNWELTAYALALLGFPMHALYRPLDNRALDKWVRETRGRRGLMLLDKFGALKQIPELLAAGAPVGFVADQNAGDRGHFVPYFGRLASTYKSIGLTAYHTRASIVVGQARRIGWNARGERPVEQGFAAPTSRHGMRYRMEIFDVFGPDDWESQPDPMFYLTARYRRAIERMVRAAPEQYLWMHRIWKSRPRHERLNRPFPESLRRKLAALPWMTDADVAAVEAQSDADRRFLAEHGLTRLP